jgi:cupredoxin-like protein
MDASNIKRRALYLVIGVLGCVLVWKIAPLFSTSGFVTRVAPAGANATQGPHAPPGSVLVNVSMIGFDPASIEAKAGQPLKLAFFRPNAANCAREVVFPDLGIRKELSPGQTVVVDITPPKSGPLGFECGMKMLKGQLIVR